MKRKLLEIPITKAVLMIYEDELLNALPRDLYAEALKRGKAIKRNRETTKRVKSHSTPIRRDHPAD